jgi:hypothetical protein
MIDGFFIVKRFGPIKCKGLTFLLMKKKRIEEAAENLRYIRGSTQLISIEALVLLARFSLVRQSVNISTPFAK